MNIHYFNPGHETAVLNASPYYMAPANVIRMQEELAFLPAWYGRESDMILVNSTMERSHYDCLYKHFPTLPHAIHHEDLAGLDEAEVILWGISPQSVHYIEELRKEYNIAINAPVWKEEYTYLNSRLAAHDGLKKIIDKLPLIDKDLLPRFCISLDEIEEAVSQTDSRLLAKAPYSSSGRGLLWLPVGGLTRTERQILHGILKKQKSVSIEKVLDKDTDFAMEFISDGKGGIEFAGYSLFYTDKKGAYESNYIGSQENISSLLEEKIPPTLLEKVKDTLRNILKDRYACLYKGCIGVDMLVYKDNDEYKLHPCLEINMRYNMGYLSLKLYENYVHPQSAGHFFIDFCSTEGDIYTRHLQMQKQYPPLIENGRLVEGYLPLCPVCESSRYWAYANVLKEPLKRP